MGNEPGNPGTLFLKRTNLTITWPDGNVQELPITQEVTRIGRGEGNDLVVPSAYKTISRQHLEIRQEGNQFRLVDLESANGVTVNGEVVKNIILGDNDIIRIGQPNQHRDIQIIFELGTEGLINTGASLSQTTPFSDSISTDAPVDTPFLSIRWPNGSTNFFPLTRVVSLIGRSPEADLHIPETLNFVSSHHFELSRDRIDFTIRDLNSTNGTLVNNQPLIPDQPTPLHSNAIIRIGDDHFGSSLGFTFTNPLEAALPVDGFIMAAPTLMIDATRELTIGRDPANDIHLDALDVSRRHARIQKFDQHYILEDLKSRNGAFVNGKPVAKIELVDGDLIQIGSYLLTFDDGHVTQYQSNGMRLDITGLSKDVDDRGGKRRIMDEVNFSIYPREFVAIVGGSGAGKTTLLNALVGIRPGDGVVQLNGHDFYEEYEHFRSQLGYVPQNDILHTSLTVEDALTYTTRLRLPANITVEERQCRISAVLETVSMNTEVVRKTRISNLSGGQRKRVSIAAELLADPKLIYLDEATSGLDPGLEKKMMHTLRRMADEGRTVLLITHATNNIVQTDHVIFISQGRLVFFGPSQEALDFFEVNDFADIYEKIERNGEQWRQVYEDGKPENYQRYVQARQATAQIIPKQEIRKKRFGLPQLFRQFLVLTQRSLKVLFSDPVTLLLMLLLLPLTGILQLIIGSKEILTGNLSILADPVAAARTMVENYAPYARTNTFVFVMGLEAVLTGLFRSIYLRERMVNLRVLPYLISKAAIYSAFVLVQVVLYLLILSIGVDFPLNGLYFPGVLEIFITLFLTMMAGISFGFIISAVSRSTEMAIYLLTMMLFFQFFFSGTVFDLRENTFKPLSYFTTTRWSLTALGVTIDIPELVGSTILCSQVPSNPLDPSAGLGTVCTNYPDAREDLLLDYNEDMLLISWGVLAGMTLLFLSITGVLLIRTRAY